MPVTSPPIESLALDIPVAPPKGKSQRTWSLWERPEHLPPLQIQRRDIDILYQTFRHRFVTVPHLRVLLGGSPGDRLDKRCRLLWQHGYLQRPSAQRPTKVLMEEIVYGLGKKGARLLEDQYPKLRDAHIGTLDWGETPKKQVGLPYVDHQLGIVTVMTCLQAAGTQGIRLHWSGHFYRKQHRIVPPKPHKPILADAYFTLTLPDGSHAHHFLEVDRGNVNLEDMHQRYLGYFAYWKALQHQERQGSLPEGRFKHFRVLLVTADPAYVNSLRRIALPVGRCPDDCTRRHQHYPAWKGLMFSHLGHFDLAKPQQSLEAIFRYADDDATISLMPQPR